MVRTSVWPISRGQIIEKVAGVLGAHRSTCLLGKLVPSMGEKRDGTLGLVPLGGLSYPPPLRARPRVGQGVCRCQGAGVRHPRQVRACLEPFTMGKVNTSRILLCKIIIVKQVV